MKARRIKFMLVQFALDENLSPLVFSTYGDCFASVNDPIKVLERLRAEMQDVNLLAEDAGKLPIRARKTGLLRRKLSSLIMRK